LDELFVHFSPQKVGKFGIFRVKGFETSFFKEIPKKIPRKVIFRGNKCTKNRPLIGRISATWRVIFLVWAVFF
jgi:hypothetical protein